MATRAASGCSSSGTCASSRCVSMSPPFDASTLPSMASDQRPGQLPDGDRRRRAFLDRRPRAGMQQCVAIDVRREIRRVFVAAARQQLGIPSRQQPDGRHRRAATARPHRPPARAGRRGDDREAENRQSGRDAHRRLEDRAAGRGRSRRPALRQSRRRCWRRRRWRRRRRSCDRRAGQSDGERKRRAERRRHRQHQPGHDERLHRDDGPEAGVG